ncbi:Aste57867_22026 [Aphanomyces stellatus]|uniref:Aste57867_22026 protein n=1 Tax=Aphanomyces stellatus TaxID=120398 RepID=A0A485LJT8_9STRA|nr:hypothetical protein As57867_021957 [Aphanomyces stellatus]VFT98694.1 Aste57867_22026 [Aphanomyces stellatus]
MSDVGYGFFPTGNEVFSGLKWIKEHPMVATAAAVGATAISIVSYLRTAKDDELAAATAHEKQHVVSWCDSHVKADAARPQTLTTDIHDNDTHNDCDKDAARALCHELQSLDLTRVKKEATWNDDDPKIEVANASPQWGWYVAITPPTDIIGQGSSSLPRAVTEPRQFVPPPPSTALGLKRTQSSKLRGSGILC